MAEEAGSGSWPWKKSWLGPPAGPADSWTVYQGKLYHNYIPNIKQQWLQRQDYDIQQADARWVNWYGKLEAGPFNTDCMSPVCVNNPQQIPPPPQPHPSPSPSPPPTPVPTPTPMPTPTPSPSPSGRCGQVVQQQCGQYIGNWNACYDCCLNNEWVVHPACPSLDDLHDACSASDLSATGFAV